MKIKCGRELSALRVAARNEWEEIVRHTIKRYRLRLQPAAQRLRIGHRTLQRWARELGLPSAPTGVHLKRRAGAR